MYLSFKDPEFKSSDVQTNKKKKEKKYRRDKERIIDKITD